MGPHHWPDFRTVYPSEVEKSRAPLVLRPNEHEVPTTATERSLVSSRKLENSVVRF
jgi:hypothetical protein